jgi:hypothetical protein
VGGLFIVAFSMTVPFLSPPYKSITVDVVKSKEDICCANTKEVIIPILSITIENEIVIELLSLILNKFHII